MPFWDFGYEIQSHKAKLLFSLNRLAAFNFASLFAVQKEERSNNEVQKRYQEGLLDGKIQAGAQADDQYGHNFHSVGLCETRFLSFCLGTFAV